MISQAERLRERWEEQKEQVTARNRLESAAFEYKHAAETVKQKCDEVLDWLNDNTDAQVDEVNQKLHKMQEVCFLMAEKVLHGE